MTGKVKLSQLGYSKFKEHLFAHDMRPGQFLSQREIAGLTGVPLGPMREALQRLEAEGLVHVVPQRGIRVADANLKLIRNTFQLRMIVEKEAARRFAEAATDRAIRDLETAHMEIVERGRRDADEALFEDAQRVDWMMHDTMVHALGNELITEIHRVNSDRIRLIRLDHGLLTPSSLGHAMDEHLAVIRACGKRDEDATVRAMEMHISMAFRRAMGM